MTQQVDTATYQNEPGSSVVDLIIWVLVWTAILLAAEIVASAQVEYLP